MSYFLSDFLLYSGGSNDDVVYLSYVCFPRLALKLIQF